MQKKRVLIIGFIFPESRATAAGWRMLKLIALFKTNYSVYFASPASPSNNSDVLEGVERVFTLPINTDEVNDVLFEIKPDIVIFDRLFTEEMFGWRVAECLPDAIRVLNTEDLHFLRGSREKWVKEHQNVAPVGELIPFEKELTNRELTSILRSNYTLIISKAEMDLLIRIFQIPRQKLVYLPLQIPQLKDELQTEATKTDFCFIGNGIHKPNEDAIEQLILHIWPKIQNDIPTAKLNIACAYTTSKIRQLIAKKKNVQLFEQIDDAQDFVKRHRVQLIPLRFGAGIKGKVLETIICETPFVTTAIGMEGIGDDYPFVTEDWTVFAQLAVALYQDEHVFQEAKLAMTQLAENYTSIDESFPLLDQQLQQIQPTDWYASLLLQQQFNAARFLSKYIMEKNKSVTD